MADKTKITNSLSRQLLQLNTQQDNLIRVNQAFLDSVISDKENISVDLKDDNENTVGTIVVPGLINLESRTSIAEESIKNLTNLPYYGSVLQGEDDAIREVYLQSYSEKEDSIARDEVTLQNFADIRENPVLDALLSPFIAAQITLPTRLNSIDRVYLERIILDDGADISNFTDKERYKDVINKLSNLSIGYTLINGTYDVDPANVRFYGKFSVITKSTNEDSTVVCKLDKLSYSDILNSVYDSRELAEGDYLSTADGKSKYTVTKVDGINYLVTLKVVGGYQTISTGTETLEFIYQETTGRTLRIPLHANEKSILFIQPVNDRNRASEYGESIILDTDTLSVQQDNLVYTYNDYIQAGVTDIGQYLQSVIEESSIPSKYAVTPDKPVLDASNFKTIQINEHLTNSKNTATIKDLNSKKNKAWQDVQAVSSEIEVVQKRINKGNYKSNTDKANDNSDLSKLIDQKTSKSAYYTSIVNDLTNISKAVKTNSVAPKYRVQGFFAVQDDIENAYTTAQKIVQYEGQYRYTSSDKGYSDSKTLSYKDANGDDITGAMPSWTDFKTEPLKRSRNDSGKLVWDENRTEDADVNNINQIDIPIQYGESVEFKVRAVSEVGYPLSPTLSEWSDVIRVDFDEALLNDDVVDGILKNNENDRIKTEVDATLKTTGISTHVGSQVVDQGVTYFHTAKELDSGFRTTEQKIISIFEKFNSLDQALIAVQDTLDRRTGRLKLEIYDSVKNESYSVNNFTTIDLFGGYYNDFVDLSDSANFGSIVEKVFYLNITNPTSQTIEILSLSSGDLEQDTEDENYNGASFVLRSGDLQATNQQNGQILYSRVKDMTSTNYLYIASDETKSVSVPSGDIEAGAQVGEKKTVYRSSSNTIERVKLKSDASLDYNVMHTNHPAYVAYEQDSGTENTAYLNEEFDRISTFTDIQKSGKQELFSDGRRFFYDSTKDKYLIGKDTVGGYLFPSVTTLKNVQVNGIDPASIKEIKSGDGNGLSIPIVFQFRMTDALGNVNGDPQNNQNINFTYNKKMGIEMIISNETFSFDINVTAKFRPTNLVSESSILNIGEDVDLNSSNTPKII